MTSAGDSRQAASTTAFVIGPGRSGTTLLYKLLCLHPQVAYLTGIEQHLPWLSPQLSGRLRLRGCMRKCRAWFDGRGNAYYARRRLDARLLPAPAEAEAVYRRCGLPLFPRPDYRPAWATVRQLREYFERLRRASGAVLLASKRTANNRRIEALQAAFPDARYLYLLRDGREVADSLARVDWWDDHPLWWDDRLRSPAQAVAEGEDRILLCARNWVAETERIAHGLQVVAPERVLQVRYETLLDAPRTEMRRIFDFLELPQRQDVEAALQSLDLGYRPGNWRRAWTSRQIDRVNQIQGALLTRLGYA